VKPRAGGTQPDLIQHWPINYVLLCNDNIGSCAVLFTIDVHLLLSLFDLINTESVCFLDCIQGGT